MKLGPQPLRIGRWYLLLAALLALLQAYWLDRVLPTAHTSRDIATAKALSFSADNPAGIPESASPTTQRQAIDLLKPEEYCHRWTSLPTAAIDCRNGLRLDTLTTLPPGPEAQQVDEIARTQAGSIGGPSSSTR